ncbi:F-box/RNI-like superfamily protein [Actinidia rufa]|uniref:F-box/RNI-like superfamily protein n=1 Tax=Actinidia rufa TaxID=165716 RepID=A0A7J0GZE4_9ERIC|nr:F-box/RNI-like superfamily protein [Actinidia rufa]
MDNVLGRDLISDLPQSIIETILTKLPIRDTVRTSILSTKWRYKWANLTHIVFDDKCGTLCNDKGPVKDNLFYSYYPCSKSQILVFGRRIQRHMSRKYSTFGCYISVAMYMTDDIAEHFEQSSSCNFAKFLGGVPCLERLIGHIYFTKYLSIGIQLGKPPITYSHLKVVELYQVSFEDMEEILVVLRLIVNSPSLEELQISGSSNVSAATEASDLDFGGKEYPTDCTFRLLKTVKMTDMSGVLHEMEFIKFLLRNSPVLKIMSITPSVYVTDYRINMLIELLRFRRASSDAEITFIQD